MKHNRLHASARLSQVLSMVSFLFAALIVAPLVPAQPALFSSELQRHKFERSVGVLQCLRWRRTYHDRRGECWCLSVST